MAKSFKGDTAALHQLMDTKVTDQLYAKLDEYQKLYYDCLMHHKVIFVDEPSGTGKTTIAVMAGIEFVRRGRKLVYIRFPSRRAERLGAAPGSIEEKEAKYMFPFYEALSECGLQDEAITILEDKGLIEARTDVRERGRNIKGSFIIIDEAQNSEDIEQLRLILTRVHDQDSTIAVIGHSAQSDGNVKRYGKDKLNAFQVYTRHMIKKPWAVCCHLVNNYRGPVSRWADKVEETILEIEGE